LRSIINPPVLSRRTLLASGAGFCAVTFIPSYALAITEKSSIDLINKVVADVLSIINSGKSEANMLRDFNSIFVNYGDVALIAKTALGAPGRTASSSQLAAYIKAFEGYISRKYGRQFRTFEGAVVSIVSTRDAGSNKGFLVKTMVDNSRQAPFEVEYWVVDRSGRPKFFDLRIEGISLISTERTEIGATLESLGGNIDRLIAKLNAS